MKETEIELETGVSNGQRAKWAEEALAGYLKGKKAEEDVEDNLSDLIADLCHLAEANGLSPLELMARAWDHYEYESKLGKEAS